MNIHFITGEENDQKENGRLNTWSRDYFLNNSFHPKCDAIHFYVIKIRHFIFVLYYLHTWMSPKQQTLTSFRRHNSVRAKSVKSRWPPTRTHYIFKNIYEWAIYVDLTDSSSFSIPVGICGTARLIAEKSGKSGSSSVMYTGIDFEASSARARNDNLLILDDFSAGDPACDPLKKRPKRDFSLKLRI